ncbi:MAG: glycosyltransferase [Planctomycetes bacterium]|nr:glycosyltransferase [Planctomycetota bacterium]
MLVVHVSLTPLAGSPIRIVSALQRHTSVRARLVNLAPNAYGTRRFPEDLDWSRDGDEARAEIARADVVHFHHWFEFGSDRNPFRFDFLGAMKRGARHLMHWHSSPEFTARNAGVDASALQTASLPQLVVAQYHERYYPQALPVPLIVDHVHAAIPPERSATPVPPVVFTPSQSLSWHAERWETKGKPEVARILRELERRRVLRASIEQELPFDACQRLRATADIVIDDVVTGSFHTTSLEALSMGKPTVCWLDARARAVLSELAGTTDLPIVDAPLQSLERVLVELCAQRALLHRLGRYAHDWMREYYREEDMVARYVRAYDELLATGTLTPPARDEHASARDWLNAGLPDLIWSARRKRFHPHRLKLALGRSVRGLRKRMEKRGGGA